MIKQIDNPVLEIHDLTVSYHRKPVLWGVDLTLPRNTTISIVGPNGAGKSTLLKAMMGLVPTDSGFVKFFDQPLDQVRKDVSYVPQRESVDWDFPASVYDVVMMGRYAHLGLFSRPKQEDKDIVMSCMEKLGILPLAKRQISELSGGQQQRVFLARALAQQAKLYLMDEPFAAVDMASEAVIVNSLKEMAAQGSTIVLVHHDLQSVSAYFDWSILLNVRVVASGPTKEIFTPQLLKETYGGQLTVLSEIGNLLKKEEFPNREKNDSVSE